MTLTDEIQTAVKNDKVIIGFKRAIKFIKLNQPKLIIMANNIPEKMRREIEENAKLSKIKIKVFNGSSTELGVICGKPFPVTTIVIKG